MFRNHRVRQFFGVILITVFVFTCTITTGLASAPAPPQIKSLPQSGMVCLTFDDGGGRTNVAKLLDCLRQYGIHCTFFITGQNLKKTPDLWRQAILDGNEICYHTMEHKSLNSHRMSNKKIIADIEKWNATAKEVLGENYQIPLIARAPYGHANSRVKKLFESLGYKLIYWSSDSLTGVDHRTAKNVAKYILRKTKIGSISLQHFGNPDINAVPLYIKELSQNFVLGKISDALAAQAANNPSSN